MRKWFAWVTKGYSGGHVKGWRSKGWVSGLAFCAMLDRVLPQKMNFQDMKEHHTPHERLEAAFAIAEEVSGTL